MHLKTPLVLAVASLAFAAPAPGLFGNFKGHDLTADALNSATSWLNDIASHVLGTRAVGLPTCDTSRIQMPDGTDLPGPDAGLVIHHVALGRGTQNYTCDTSNPSSAPVAAGAKATLFNVTCWTSMFPFLVEAAPSMAVHFSLSDMENLNPWGLQQSGVHYFRDAKTPFFDLDTSSGQYGVAPCAKLNATNAPATAARGQKGDAAVPWLKMNTVQGATGGMKNAFRTNTAGGSPPATCKGMASHFEVQYSALYWYWSEESK